MDSTQKKQLYQSMIARDPRYDGRFYVGVTTTGIYCRPICPAKPKIENVLFFKSKAEAEAGGFRPCLRCKPDLSPLSLRWQGTAAIMSRALYLVEEGDQAGEDLGAIAERLGMSDRHLRRLFQEHIGASPIEVALSRRLHLARQLLSQSQLSILDVALASGFGSLRRFNDAFAKTYKTSPSSYRKDVRRESNAELNDVLSIDLPYVPPYDWENLTAFLKRHLAHGIESFEGETYLRHFQTPQGPGFYTVRNDSKKCLLQISIRVSALRDLRPVIERIRTQFDLGHNPHHIEAVDAENTEMALILTAARAMRIPGSFDPFETAVSVILSQLVSTERARENLKQLILKYGQKIDSPYHTDLTHAFPTSKVLMDADFEGLGFTRARAAAIREIAREVFEGRLELSQKSDLETTRAQLLAIKGIGPWTVEVIALRCLCDPNAFPGRDLIIARAVEKFGIGRAFLDPWRAYLALAIWKTQWQLLSKKGKKS